MKHVAKKRERDKQVIEAVVRGFGPVSRVGVHDLTHLRRSTISLLVRELLEEGKLLEAGPSDNAIGRKQTLLRLNEDFGFIVGIEFDDETVVAGVLNLEPRIKHLVREPARLEGGMDGLTTQLIACARRAIMQAEVNPRALLGVGIADPGLVDSRRGITIFSSTIDFWKQVPLKHIFEREFRSPVLVESKTRAKTLAERMLGAGEKRENMIYVDYGTGIGAGVIVDGKLLYGEDCAVGELGHTHIVEGGPACKCGSIGCLEALAGAVAVGARIRKALGEGAQSQALALAEGDPSKITAWTVLHAARLDDKICSNVVAEIGNLLGLGVANLVNLFNPSVVVFDKRLELAGEGLIEQIARIVRRQALSSSSERLALRYGKLGNEAGVLGIGLAVLEKHFEIPALRPPRFMIEAVSPAQKLQAV